MFCVNTGAWSQALISALLFIRLSRIGINLTCFPYIPYQWPRHIIYKKEGGESSDPRWGNPRNYSYSQVSGDLFQGEPLCTATLVFFLSLCCLCWNCPPPIANWLPERPLIALSSHLSNSPGVENSRVCRDQTSNVSKLSKVRQWEVVGTWIN